jgi:AAA15 family ATPase/GTPase
MKYSKFTIKNFKGIKEIVLDLEQQPLSQIITLVGLNESGKTSILEAINLLQHNLPKEDRHKLIPKKHKLNFSGEVTIESKINVSILDNELILKELKNLGFETIKQINEITIEKIYIFKDSQFHEEKNLWSFPLQAKKIGEENFVNLNGTNEIQKIIVYIKDNLIPKILYYTDFLFDFPSRIYLDLDFSIKNTQSQFREVVQDILTSIDSELTIEDHLLKRLKDKSDSAQEALDHTLSTMSTKTSKIVLGAWKNIMDIKGKEIFIEAKSESVSSNFKLEDGSFKAKNVRQYYLEFKLKEGSEKYFISERSLGFKWFFTFLLFTEFRKSRKTDNGETLFLLDEPASNLHSTAQKKLLNKFENLAENSKLVYTTHSHHLINPLWLSGTYIVKNEAIDYSKEFDFDTSETNIKTILYKQFVSQNPKQQDYFQPILDALEHQPGLLEKIPKIILTEGKFDYYILKYINDIILKNQFKNLKLYPGNGADSNDQVIKLYLAWARDFKILLDGDSGGTKAKVRYLKTFGDIIKDEIITFTEIDSKWEFPIEDLFSEVEKIFITQKFDSSALKFEKSKFNTAIQNLLITKEEIGLSAQTKERFIKLLNKIK